MCSFRRMYIENPISLDNGPPLRYISTISNAIEERACCIFIYEVALFFNFYFLMKSMNVIINFL